MTDNDYFTVPDHIVSDETLVMSVPPGLIIQKDFITESEEKQLLACLDWDTENQSSTCRLIDLVNETVDTLVTACNQLT